MSTPPSAPHRVSDVAVAGCNCEACVNLRGQRTTEHPGSSNAPTSSQEKLTDEQRVLIEQLATSISKLCHRVIARRLGQFFEVIGEEIAKMTPGTEPTVTSKEMVYRQAIQAVLDDLTDVPQEWARRIVSAFAAAIKADAQSESDEQEEN